jgi:hypothetical protein
MITLHIISQKDGGEFAYLCDVDVNACKKDPHLYSWMTGRKSHEESLAELEKLGRFARYSGNATFIVKELSGLGQNWKEISFFFFDNFFSFFSTTWCGLEFEWSCTKIRAR